MSTQVAHHHHSDMDPARRAVGVQRALGLEYFSLAWNFLETFVGFALGLASGSVALMGFALDSVVESTSAGALIWRLRKEQKGEVAHEEVERRAVRLVGVAFFALALYIGGQAVYDLVTRSQPEASVPGIVLAAVSVVVMPWLAARKRRWAVEIDSRALEADSDQTSLCTYISVFLLVGLGANAWLGWWWADPVAALVIAGFAANEGRELWTTQRFCTC